ncbi:MAG: type 2 isopentenyl-diphosphate Delta-isomerase [Chloroflexi bacterium]|nr:type 2 isopentenyl-diphosphate Delta-isomerase [Chloroflexota bacterium]
MEITVSREAKASLRRKAEHLSISLEQDVAFKEVSTGLENYSFVHQALPEIDAASVDVSLDLFGKRLASPIVISCMTGGIQAAAEINRRLAEAAQALGLAMGVGSQRVAIEDGERARYFQIRDVAPDILLFANLGAVQLNNGYGVRECQAAVDMVGADALVLHLNPLQEVLQGEGNTNYAGLLRRIEAVCRVLPVPVIVKEVGWGISGDVARKLAEAGVTGIDVAGSGGTCWSEVEKHRAPDSQTAAIAASFASWGIPTAESIRMARAAAPNVTIIGSGGVRTGLDVAKCIALGADAAGLAWPLLRAAKLSSEAVTQHLSAIVKELKVAMFCIGAQDLGQLKATSFLRSVGSMDRS